MSNKPMILVVEDDAAVRNLMAVTLETRDYRYHLAQNGAEALIEATTHQPDVMLLDLGLPDMDGVEIIRKVRGWSNMPIIVISARSEDSDKVEALDAGAEECGIYELCPQFITNIIELDDIDEICRTLTDMLVRFMTLTFDQSEVKHRDIISKTVKYVSDNSHAGTVEIRRIIVEEGSAAPVPPTPGPETQSIPYTQPFAYDFGTYMTYSVSGAQNWVIDYNTAKMTGYVSGVSYGNEDWLISSPVAITGVNNAKMIMVYIGRYFENINEDVTVWVSTNYNYGDNPTTATWRRLSSTLSEGGDWSTFFRAEVDLNAYVGQTVIVAVKYLSTSNRAGTIEIKSISIEEGNATPPGVSEGSGTANDPYNVTAGRSHQNTSTVAWVRGYIVGSVKNGMSTISSNDDINWSAPFDGYTNVVLADNPTCREIDNCIIVNLPAGKPLRTEVNLVDHPENYGKRLTVLGTLRTYFGKAGVRDSEGAEDDFVLEE